MINEYQDRFDDGYNKQFHRNVTFALPEPKRIYEPVPKFIGPRKIRNRDCMWDVFDASPCFSCEKCRRDFYN